MPRRYTATRFLEQSLIVEHADAGHAHEIGSDLGEAPCQHETSSHGVVLPEVHDLQEGLAIGVALRERPGLGSQTPHGSGDGGL